MGKELKFIVIVGGVNVASKSHHEQFAQIIERFSAWADEQEDIRLAMIVGSRARTTMPADEWSDLDVVFFF